MLMASFICLKVDDPEIDPVSLGKPFNFHEWPRQNFSLQNQYNIYQTSDENKEKY